MNTFALANPQMKCHDDVISYFFANRILKSNHTHLSYLYKRYEAEIDQGHAFRCCQPWIAVLCLPAFWVWGAARGFETLLHGCSCDEVVCWLRKEYSTRNFFRVYPNRIESNVPTMRIPFGFLGCGSWNADHIVTNVSLLIRVERTLFSALHAHHHFLVLLLLLSILSLAL